eukprot:489542_1
MSTLQRFWLTFASIVLCNSINEEDDYNGIVKQPFTNCVIPPETGYTTIISPRNGACITLSTKYPVGTQFLQDVLDTPKKWMVGLRRSDDSEVAFANLTSISFDEFASGQVLSINLCRRIGGQIYSYTSISSFNNLFQSATNFKQAVIHKFGLDPVNSEYYMYMTDMDDFRDLSC